MSEKKVINEEELNKVAGGTFVEYKYKVGYVCVYDRNNNGDSHLYVQIKEILADVNGEHMYRCDIIRGDWGEGNNVIGSINLSESQFTELLDKAPYYDR